MDRNLGATRLAQSATDSAAFGWLFQWGRKADGHQYTAWGGQTGTGQPALSNTVANTAATIVSYAVQSPNNVNFLTSTGTGTTTNLDWLLDSQRNDNLWVGSSGGVNNPCPPGWRVPTGGLYSGTPDGNGNMQGEWFHMLTLANITTTAQAFASPLKFTLNGSRSVSGSLGSTQGNNGEYWSSSTSGTATLQYLGLYNTGTSLGLNSMENRAVGAAVRCIKN